MGGPHGEEYEEGKEYPDLLFHNIHSQRAIENDYSVYWLSGHLLSGCIVAGQGKI